MSRNKSKKVPEYITERITIEKLVPGGQGLATLSDGENSGKKVFLWNALPGEIATRIQLTKNKSTYTEGIVLDFEKPSPHRIPPRDDCYLSTSPWQIMTYDYELEQKHALLQEIFRQQKIDLPSQVEIAPIQTDGKDFHYRNKMEYALYFDHCDQKIHPAFRARGSHQKVIVDSSSLERPEIFQKAQQIIAELNKKHEEARRYQSLLLRANQSSEVSGGLIENHQPRPRFSLLEDAILGQTYSYSPNGFFQINLPVYEMALHEIEKEIQQETWQQEIHPATTQAQNSQQPRPRKVLDLYAGVGTIGLSVARDQDLTLVECDKPAYLEMERNCQEARRQGANVHSVLAKSEEALDYVEPEQIVIVDPPRAGCRPELLDKFLEVQPEVIIYLSCNPATQARDLKILTSPRPVTDSSTATTPDSPVYEIKKVIPFNFFPRTPHLENLVILHKKSAVNQNLKPAS